MASTSTRATSPAVPVPFFGKDADLSVEDKTGGELRGPPGEVLSPFRSVNAFQTDLRRLSPGEHGYGIAVGDAHAAGAKLVSRGQL